MDNSQSAKDRAARNEVLFRQVNERVKDVSDAFSAVDTSPVEFMCECGLSDCTEAISLTRAEYERVRSSPTHFFVLPDHALPEVETVLREGNGYVVVEKLAGEGDVAVETDPRASS